MSQSLLNEVFFPTRQYELLSKFSYGKSQSLLNEVFFPTMLKMRNSLGAILSQSLLNEVFFPTELK